MLWLVGWWSDDTWPGRGAAAWACRFPALQTGDLQTCRVRVSPARPSKGLQPIGSEPIIFPSATSLHHGAEQSLIMTATFYSIYAPCQRAERLFVCRYYVDIFSHLGGRLEIFLSSTKASSSFPLSPTAEVDGWWHRVQVFWFSSINDLL